MRHVDHERGADLVGDLAQPGEVRVARVGRVPGDQDQRPELAGLGGDRVVVEQPGVRVGAVAGLLEHLAGDVVAEAVGQVAARVQRHAHHPLGAELTPQPLPRRRVQGVDVLRALAVQEGPLDPAGQDGPVGDEVRVDAGVRLDVGVVRAEQRAGVAGGQRLDLVHDLAAGVETVPDGAFGVLVRQPGAHGHQDGGRGVVLRRDELELTALVREFVGDGAGHGGLGARDHLEHRTVADGDGGTRGRAGRDGRYRRGGGDSGLGHSFFSPGVSVCGMPRRAAGRRTAGRSPVVLHLSASHGPGVTLPGEHGRPGDRQPRARGSPMRCTRREFVLPGLPSGEPFTITSVSPFSQRRMSSSAASTWCTISLV